MHFKAIEAHLKQNGRAAGQHQGHHRGRGGGRQRATSTTSSARHKDDCSRPTSSSSPTRRCSIAASRRSATACAGSSYFQIDLRGTKSDLHSGSFGGAVANPAFVLAQMLAQMKDHGGRIKIPGFYDDVRPLQRRGAGGVARSCRSTRRSTARSSARRSCSARRGYTHARARVGAADVRGERAARRASPARARRPCCRPWRWPRSACGSCRTRIRRRSRELFEAYVKKVAPKTVELKVTRMHGGKPWMTEFDNPFVQAAGRAIEQGFGKAPVFNREGGSIPVVSTFQEELGRADACCSASGCRTRTRTRRTRSSTSATSTTASSPRRTCTTRSGR